MRLAKPNQDLRFDLPCDGPRTIQVMAEPCARVMAIEGHKTLVVDRDPLTRAADDAGVTVIALTQNDLRG